MELNMQLPPKNQAKATLKSVMEALRQLCKDNKKLQNQDLTQKGTAATKTKDKTKA
jgi:hypothetical protein